MFAAGAVGGAATSIRNGAYRSIPRTIAAAVYSGCLAVCVCAAAIDVVGSLDEDSPASRWYAMAGAPGVQLAAALLIGLTRAEALRLTRGLALRIPWLRGLVDDDVRRKDQDESSEDGGGSKRD